MNGSASSRVGDAVLGKGVCHSPAALNAGLSGHRGTTNRNPGTSCAGSKPETPFLRHSGVMSIEAVPSDSTAGPPLPPSTDSETLAGVVRRAQGGDLGAFEALYRATSGRVFALCLRICGDAARAEDLTQDVYVRAWRKLSLFRGESAFSSWLYRLAINVIYSDLRRQRSRGMWEPLPEPDGPGEPQASRVDPVDTLLVEQAIAGLPPGARAVLVLYHLVGLQHGEIAQHLGIAVGTSKAQLHRAHRLLRKVV